MSPRHHELVATLTLRVSRRATRSCRWKASPLSAELSSSRLSRLVSTRFSKGVLSRARLIDGQGGLLRHVNFMRAPCMTLGHDALAMPDRRGVVVERGKGVCMMSCTVGEALTHSECMAGSQRFRGLQIGRRASRSEHWLDWPSLGAELGLRTEWSQSSQTNEFYCDEARTRARYVHLVFSVLMYLF